MTEKKPTVSDRADKGEPHELALWRRIAQHRDNLVRDVERWTSSLEGESSRSPNDEESIAELRDRVDTTKDALDAFDTAIDRLRRNKQKAYGVKKLEALADRYERSLDKHALDKVALAVRKNADEHDEYQAGFALEVARQRVQPGYQHDPTARPFAIPDEVARDHEGLRRDIEDARAQRLAKNETSGTVARRVVNAKLGNRPHARKLR